MYQPNTIGQSSKLFYVAIPNPLNLQCYLWLIHDTSTPITNTQMTTEATTTCYHINYAGLESMIC